MVEIQGLKPWASAMPWQRSNQLSYIPILNLHEYTKYQTALQSDDAFAAYVNNDGQY